MQTRKTKRTSLFSRYLTWSEEDELWRIVCTDAGYCEVASGVPYPPNIDSHPDQFRTVAEGRTLNDYHVVYITRGRGFFETQGQCYMVIPGSLFLLFPGVRHVYKPDIETGWSEYWVGFNGAHIDALHRAGFISPDRPYYEPGINNAILSHYLQILDLVRKQQRLYQLKASALILGLVAEILACERSPVQSNCSEELVIRAKFLMEEQIDNDTNLNVIADTLEVSTSHLNNLFKRYTSMTPHRYLINIKMVRAKDLLDQGVSVKEVASLLGFNDEYYFSRLFKSKTGFSPSQWKQSVEKE
jgi:AraC-like DNA-binding protein